MMVAASICAAALNCTAADPAFTLPAETTRLKPGPGLEVVQQNCVLCHSVDYISIQPRLTAAQWRASVVKMQSKYGAPIATNRIDEITGYLSTNYGSATATNAASQRP